MLGIGNTSIEIKGLAIDRGWTGGETLTGEVHVITSEPVLTRSITILLHGTEKVQIETTEMKFGM